jgi:hypothetical protein
MPTGSRLHLAEHLARAGRAKLPGLSVNALPAGRDAGIAVHRDSGFRDGTRPAVGGGRGGEGMRPRHGDFDATDLRNAQALDAPSSVECCLSLKLCVSNRRLLELTVRRNDSYVRSELSPTGLVP